jgi:hypothetical protein
VSQKSLKKSRFQVIFDKVVNRGPAPYRAGSFGG